MQKRPLPIYQHYLLPAKYPLQVTLSTSVNMSAAQNDEPFHIHDCAEFAVCRAGSGQAFTYHGAVSFQQGDVLFFCPFTPHRITPADSCRIEYLHINLLQIQDPNIFTDLHEFACRLLLPNELPILLSYSNNSVFYDLLALCLEEARHQRPYYEMSIRGYLLCLVARLKHIWTSPSEAVDHMPSQTGCILSPALAYLSLHFTDDIMITDLAQKCHLSETHFRRLFKEIFHISPLDYLNRIRIQESCTLMSGWSIHISQAAAKAGFRNLSSYNRKFQEVCKMSPSEWVRDVLPQTEKIPKIVNEGMS